MRLIAFPRHPAGRRCYLLGRYRCHHGPVGLLVAMLGAWWAWTDRHDFPWPLRDRA